MSSTITVHSSHIPLRDEVQEWLDRTSLDPPGGLRLDIEIDDDIPPPPDDGPVFYQPYVSVYFSPDTGDVTIRWESAPAVAAVPLRGSRATVRISREAFADLDRCRHFFITAAIIFLMRRVGWHHVHAATAIDPLGRGWLLAGNWKAGKSTTSALLASRGWAVGHDDMVFLTRGDDGVEAVARRGNLALREDGRERLGPLDGEFGEQPTQTRFAVEELGGTWVQRVRPDILVFMSVGHEVTTLDILRPSEVLSGLVRWSSFVIVEPSLAQEHLDLISDLGKQARAFRATVGPDLFGNPNRLMELVS